ncbi:MAG: haloacid dehalogenase [Desulfurococcaceae archaeon]|jgi:translin|nr:haloacid dehalogenase [Desulfurococcaceae archaeon]
MNSIETMCEVLRRDLEEINDILSEKDRVREEAIKLSRNITRLSSRVVSNIHREKFEEAKLELASLREHVRKLLDLVKEQEDLKYSGIIYNSLSEYVEASLLYSIVVEERFLTLRELDTLIIPYLQGLGDLVGELRRLVVRLLDQLRVEEAEKYAKIMEVIYEGLKVLNYPDHLIPGVRHKVDVAARLVEDTRVLILNTKNSLRCYQHNTMK